MTAAEKRWCLTVGIALILLSTLPYLIGYFTQTPDWTFSGFVLGIEDGNSYIAKMLSGSSGEWLFRSPYSAEPQQGVAAFLPYILLGKLASGQAVHEQLVGLLQIMRWAGIVLLVYSLYRFTAIFIESAWWRKWVVVLSLVGGGLGWIILLVGRSDWLGTMPLDLYSPETFGFLSVMTFPHLIWARAILFLALTEYLQSQERAGRAWISGVYFLILVFVQPLSVISGYAVIAAHQGYLLLRSWQQERRIRWSGWMSSGLKVLVVSGPAVVYLGVAFLGDPYLDAWTQQNIILSPHPLHYLLAYGLVLPWVIWGMVQVVKQYSPQNALLASWIAILPILAYFPINLQRRFPEGGWIALLLAAAIGLQQLSGTRQKWAWAVLLLSMPTSALIWMGALNSGLSVSTPAFVAAEDVAGFDWLRDHARPNAVVLAPYQVGNNMPAWAPVHVVIGHGPESVGLDELQPLVDAFYQGRPSEESYGLIARFSVDYIWYPPAVQPSDTLINRLELELVYQQGGIQIMSVPSEAADD